MEITDKLEKDQYVKLYQAYNNFFKEINFEGNYTSELIDVFSRKKVLDSKRKKKKNKFYYAIHNGEIVGFINGKIYGNVGLICHAFVNEDYKNSHVFLQLFKALSEWFKNYGVEILEIEVNVNNPIREFIESSNWQLDRSFDDASVYQRRI